MAGDGFIDHPLVPKLAAWVGAGGESGSRGGGYAQPRTLAVVVLALAAYDREKGSNTPNLWLVVRSRRGGVLLEAEWENGHSDSDGLVSESHTWEDLKQRSVGGGGAATPQAAEKEVDPLDDTLLFRLQGTGEVSVGAELHFIPARPPPLGGGVYRGLLVRKVLQRADPVSGQ